MKNVKELTDILQGSEISDEEMAEKDTRLKIIFAAAKLFAEKGLDGTSTREIAEHTGSNISLISYYFGGKEGLYKAVIQQFATQAKERFQKVYEHYDAEKMDKESFLAFMKALITGMVTMKSSKPEIATIMQREILSGLPYCREVHDTTFSNLCDAIVGILDTAKKKKILKPDVNSQHLFLSMVFSADHFIFTSRCHSNFIDKHMYQFPKDLNPFIEQHFKLFIEGNLL